MGLTNVLSSIQADCVANLSAPLNAVTFVTGRRGLAGNDAPPRIAWVRRAGSYAPNQQGVRTIAQPRNLRLHITTVEAHVWCAPDALNGDDTDTETLAHTLVASAYRMAHGSFEVLGDDWPQPAWATLGFLCVVTFQFRIPVLDALVTTVTTASATFDQTTAPPPHGQLQAPGDT